MKDRLKTGPTVALTPVLSRKERGEDEDEQEHEEMFIG
jgi:hypothetical protein